MQRAFTPMLPAFLSFSLFRGDKSACSLIQSRFCASVPGVLAVPKLLPHQAKRKWDCISPRIIHSFIHSSAHPFTELNPAQSKSNQLTSKQRLITQSVTFVSTFEQFSVLNGTRSWTRPLTISASDKLTPTNSSPPSPLLSNKPTNQVPAWLHQPDYNINLWTSLIQLQTVNQ